MRAYRYAIPARLDVSNACKPFEFNNYGLTVRDTVGARLF